MALHLQIVTPEKKIFSDTVGNVYLPGADGELGILDGHAALVTALKPGELRYEKNGKTEILALLQARRDNAAKPTRWFSKLIGWFRR